MALANKAETIRSK